jgi:MerR family transcriptional regulator, light-induced transcriptional regulator
MKSFKRLKRWYPDQEPPKKRDEDMITEQLFQNYLNDLLGGRRSRCLQTVRTLIDKDIGVKQIYVDLFQRSMYQVGEFWEENRITVANEHLATAITENLISLIYPKIFSRQPSGKKAIIACTVNEYHQIGAKMVADILEMNGWDGYFLGANTPPEEVLPNIQDIQPDVVGFSLSMPSNVDNLKHAIEMVKTDFPRLELVYGGQAFRWLEKEPIGQHTGVRFIETLDELEAQLAHA